MYKDYFFTMANLKQLLRLDVLVTAMSAYKRVQQWATFARTWHIYDLKFQDPFKSANVVKHYLKGLHKPIYHPTNDCGDVVVAINSRDIAMKGNEWRKRAYFHHTGYPGGASWTVAWELHQKNPTLVFKKAVYRSLAGNLERHYTMQRLFIYPDDKIPLEIMENVSNYIKPLRPVPDRLDEIPEEVIKNFPKVMDFPKEYIIR